MSAKMTNENCTSQGIKEIIKIVNHVKKTENEEFNYEKLDKNILYTVVYSDHSFANIKDNTSQMEYLILLQYKSDNGNALHYSSHNARRLTRFVLGGEQYVFADNFGIAYTIKRDLEQIVGKHIPLKMNDRL